MSSLRLKLFGPVQAWVDDQPLPRLRTRKGYLLLALLALRGGAPVSRDWLIGTLWPESDQEAGAMSLRRALHDLRAALGAAEEAIESPDRRHLCLNPAHAQVDVLEFVAATARFERTGEWADAEQAAGLYVGALLSDCDDDLIQAERQRFHQQAQTLLLALAQVHLDRGAATKAVTLMRQAEALDPLHEASQRLLYQALAAAGDPAGARRAYREFRLRLYEELRQEPAPETRQCLENLSTAATATRREAMPSAPDTLPLFLSTFLGREQNQQALLKRLGQGRLTTLLGPGGVGKTRLAVETARASTSLFPEGLFFVDLTTLLANALPEALWNALAQAVCGDSETEQQAPRTRVFAVLRSRQALLLLDNAEHLRESVATVTSELLGAATDLRVLITSRVPLGLAGEQLQTLEPLSLPGSASLAAVVESDAALFFVQRAQTLRPDFALTPENAPEIVQICQRLDGLPLALELAAARLRLMSLGDLTQRLTDPLPFLSGSSQLADRQRTLENLIAWSYTPLAPQVQALFRRLALFPDTFGLEAVEWIGGDANGLEHLSMLVDASLIQVSEDSHGSTRYRLLETIRAFARARLAESADSAVAYARLAHWGLDFLTRAYTGLWGSEGGAWLRRIAQELPNLHAALEAGDGETALPIARLLEQFWWRTNRFRDGVAWFTLALSKPGGSESERLTNELSREQFRHLMGEPNTIVETLIRTIALYKSDGNQEGAFYLSHTLALILSKQGCHQEAETWARDSLALAALQPDDPLFFQAYAELALVEVLQVAGRFTEARTYGEAALERFQTLNRDAHVVQVRLQLGRALLGEGSLSAAHDMLLEGLHGAQNGGMRDLELELLLALGDTALARQDTVSARRWYETILHTAEQGGLQAPATLARNALESL